MILRSLSNSEIQKSGEFVSMVCKGRNHDSINESEPHTHNPLKPEKPSIIFKNQSGPNVERRTKTLVIMSQLDLKDHRPV